MEARELRIGNLIADDKGNFIEVANLDDHQWINNMGESYYQPIPLTPDILIACGFEQSIDKKGDCWDCEGFRLWHDGKGFYHINSETLTQFDYLHHLQNYYHALCLEELTINLKTTTT